eukprot:TRINITY_DN2399_c0_g1_i1.p1 TRINITY_DN2399_c0_g1~~TRINITY_DN2399_c0_g1_i1.p1  ORF type:complete len:101 (+),score=50.25 TRINITY_DN2399_c0_g1_i1:34-336(+)
MFFFFLMIRRPPRSTQSRSSAASDVFKRQPEYSLRASHTLPGEPPSAVLSDSIALSLAASSSEHIADRGPSNPLGSCLCAPASTCSWLSLIHISEPTRPY